MSKILRTMVAAVVLSAGLAAVYSGSALARDGSSLTTAPHTVHAHPGVRGTCRDDLDADVSAGAVRARIQGGAATPSRSSLMIRIWSSMPAASYWPPSSGLQPLATVRHHRTETRRVRQMS
jgi:hypothetical protein